MDFIRKLVEQKKSPKEVVAQAKTCISSISVDVLSGSLQDSKTNKVIPELSKLLVEIREILYSTNDTDSKKQEVNDLAREIYQTDLLFILLCNLEYLEFEARKDVEKIFNNLLKLIINGRSSTVEYICGNPKLLEVLVNG